MRITPTIGGAVFGIIGMLQVIRFISLDVSWDIGLAGLGSVIFGILMLDANLGVSK